MNVESFLDGVIENFPRLRHFIVIIVAWELVGLVIIHLTIGLVATTLYVALGLGLGWSLLIAVFLYVSKRGG